MIPNIGPMELAVVLIIALVVLGPKKLPEVGRSVGHGMREFKRSITGGAETNNHAVAAVEPDTPALASGNAERPATAKVR